jgi:hypothetical protein
MRLVEEVFFSATLFFSSLCPLRNLRVLCVEKLTDIFLVATESCSKASVLLLRELRG